MKLYTVILTVIIFTSSVANAGYSWNITAIHLQGAWSITKGDGSITIAVVDSGINWNVSALSTDNRWENTKEINGITGVDDDGNGYVDDYYGWDFVENDNTPSTDNTGEIAGHGTMVTSILVSRDREVQGIAPNIKVMTIRALDSNGTGYFSEIYQGIEYAINNNASVINLSIGLQESADNFMGQLMEQLAYKAEYYNTSIVVAAGNEGGEVNFYGKINRTICVSAMEPDGSFAEYSNRGPQIDLIAPGSSIPVIYKDGKVYVGDGTSFAAPHVSGTIALMRSVRNDLPAWYYKNILEYSADDVFEPGVDEKSGYGLVNAYQAVLDTLNFANIDFDKDKMPSEFEMKHGLNPFFDDSKLDNDGDGVSNYNEYIDGSNPNNAQDFKPWILRHSNIKYIFSIIIITIVLLYVFKKKLYLK